MYDGANRRNVKVTTLALWGEFSASDYIPSHFVPFECLRVLYLWASTLPKDLSNNSNIFKRKARSETGWLLRLAAKLQDLCELERDSSSIMLTADVQNGEEPLHLVNRLNESRSPYVSPHEVASRPMTESTG